MSWWQGDEKSNLVVVGWQHDTLSLRWQEGLVDVGNHLGNIYYGFFNCVNRFSLNTSSIFTEALILP